MQAATMTGTLVMVGAAEMAPAGDAVRVWAVRLAKAAFIVVGLVATVMILDQMGVLAAYGLPAPFLRRKAVPVAEAAVPVADAA